MTKRARQSAPCLDIRLCGRISICALILSLNLFSVDAAQRKARTEMVAPPVDIAREAWSHPPLPDRILETARGAQLELEAQGSQRLVTDLHLAGSSER
jgi:hypothetical protein